MKKLKSHHPVQEGPSIWWSRFVIHFHHLNRSDHLEYDCWVGPNFRIHLPSDYIIHCPFYQNIREEYLPKFILLNPNISSIFNDEKQAILSILDPVSSKLPDIVRNGWSSVNAAYDVSRKFCSDMHKKRDKFYTNLDKDNKWTKPINLLY